MSFTFHKDRHCAGCGKQIADQSKIGYCHHCYVTIYQKGSNNGFFGKHHTEETKKIIADKARAWTTNKIATDPKFREAMRRGATKPRSEDAKHNIKLAATKMYVDHPYLRKLRGQEAQCRWQEGTNHFRTLRNKKSQGEKELFKYFSNSGKYKVSDVEIKVGDRKYLSPDIIINDYVCIEFFGDYFHANPKIYKSNFLIKKKNKLAGEIWEEDAKRIALIEKNGFVVIVVWEHDYKHDKQAITRFLENKIDMLLQEREKNDLGKERK